MCFSAPISFATGGVLGVVGAASMKKANKKQILFAVIPILFAIQQLLEGIQWLTPQPSNINTLVGYAFLVFAFATWPVYLPVMVYVLEKNKKRKQELLWYVGIGIILSVYALMLLLTNELFVSVENLHVIYNIYIPHGTFVTIVYVALVAGAPMRSTDQIIRWFGAGILLAGLLSWLFFTEAYISVWCFFAAIVSGFIYWAILKQQKNLLHEKRRT